MCECNCHKLGAALCGACCFHEEVIKEKNKYMAYPHPTDMLFKRVDKLELLADTINAHQHGAEDMIRKVSNELDQDLSLAIKRIDTLENHVCFNKDNRQDLDKALHEIQNDYRREVGSLESSVEHTQEGIEKCFERIEKEHKDANDALIALQDFIDIELDILKGFNIETQKGFNRLSERIEELEDKFRVLKIYDKPLQAQMWQENILKRLEKLEGAYQSDFESTKEVILALSQQKERIEKLELWKEAAIEKNIQDNQRMKEIERYQEITHLEYKATSKKPHRCPVCEGKGKIHFTLPAGGYWEQDCKPCETKGIVWG